MSWRERLSQPTFEVGEWERDIELSARDGSRSCRMAFVLIDAKEP
jgi:hypothetical protein